MAKLAVACSHTFTFTRNVSSQAMASSIWWPFCKVTFAIGDSPDNNALLHAKHAAASWFKALMAITLLLVRTFT